MDNWDSSFNPTMDHHIDEHVDNHLDNQFNGEQFNLPHHQISNIDDNFLHQLEQNLYHENLEENLSHSHMPQNLSHNHLSGIDNLSHGEIEHEVHSDLTFIIPEDININEVYPPTSLPENTPLLLPNKKNSDSKLFLSPILRGQNEKSYNDQHLYHKQQSQAQPQVETQTQSQSQAQAQTLSLTQAQPKSVQPQMVFTPLVSPAVTPMEKYQPPAATSFEPLTSPALHAADRLRSSSSMFGPGEDHAATNYKRRTPHGTPVLQANNHSNNHSNNHNNSQSNTAKPSPSLKGRSASSYRVNNVSFEKLPESSSAPDSNSNSMLPPKLRHDDEQPPLMGFTMGRLAEESTQPHNSRKSSNSASSSTTSSPNIPKANDKKAVEKPSTKKASHKLAEQGRRNRMNMAVHELGTLIPQDYHDEVLIPSKATTVELASKYIRALLSELQELKNN